MVKLLEGPFDTDTFDRIVRFADAGGVDETESDPSDVVVSSMTSRVVPWMSLTIALSSFSRTFSRVDFPAFVSPMIATGMPFLIAFPTLKELADAI